MTLEAPIRNDRLLPCRLLQHKGIACAVWFEDAIAHYGVPTVLFDLYVLVSLPHVAAQELVAHGWTLLSRPAKVGNADVENMLVTLAPPTATDKGNRKKANMDLSVSTTTVLLSAADWNFELPKDSDILPGISMLFPSLPTLLDALMDSMLDAQLNSMLRIHLVCQISYLYAHVQELRRRSFAELLRPEHRQYHYDLLAGMNSGSIQFQAHQRKIRDAIKEGVYKLRECSANYDDDDFFTERKEAELLASMPSPGN